MKLNKSFKFLTVAASCFLATAALAGPPSHARDHDKGKPGNRSGLIKVSKHVVNLDRCENDELSIKVKIPHNFHAFWKREADAHLVAAFPADDETGRSEFASWNLRDVLANNLESEDEEEREHPLFRLGCDFLESIPSGAYQFSIVMTIAGGDPAKLSDWHRGFQGLVATSRIKISEGEDESDLDGDGEVDGDADFDGLIDEDEEESEDDESQEDNDDDDDEDEEEDDDEEVSENEGSEDSAA